MLEKIEILTKEASADIEAVKDKKSLEDYRLKYISRNGIISSLFEEFKTVDKSVKGQVGKALNELKKHTQNLFEGKRLQVESGESSEGGYIDLTLPGRTYNTGTKHLITQAMQEICGIFEKIGFSVFEGNEIEDEYHNFDALNTPDYHPSRDMQDTFYIKTDASENRLVLRTHTSPGQIRVMEAQKPPIRVVVPGRVYRNEAISSRSLEMFHQVEGLYVDKKVTFRELKSTLEFFAKEFFGKDLKIRMRPSYFPFTEPSAEVDVECYLCKGNGCRVCKYTGWLEILGCGMVDPNVFKFVDLDPEEYSGYAFGMGIERTLMVKYGIPDIRMFYENDIRFLKQFK